MRRNVLSNARAEIAAKCNCLLLGGWLIGNWRFHLEVHRDLFAVLLVFRLLRDRLGLIFWSSFQGALNDQRFCSLMSRADKLMDQSSSSFCGGRRVERGPQ